MRAYKAVAALGLAIILCVFWVGCGGSSAPPAANPPVIFESTLPTGAVNSPYRAVLHLVQGTGTSPFTWSIISGSLPAGLTLDSSGGLISGTPTTIGNATFTVQVSDAKSLTGTKSLSINVRGAVSITSTTLPGGTVSIPYNATVTATGGILPYTWSVASGSLPAGLTLTANADNTATISGTPTTLGSSTFTLQVADAETPPATGTSTSLSIQIEGFVTITTTSLPTGYVGIFYDSQLMAAGGTQPYTWTLTSGTLPPGLTLTEATGVISGTPTTTGSYPISVMVTDSERTPATATGSLTITIDPTPQLQVTTSSLDSGTEGVYYNKSVTATGGIPPYSWTLTAGTLPVGLTLSGTGVISGTPTAHGSFPITVQVKDTAMNTAAADLSFTINPGPLVVTTTALPSGTQSAPYSAALLAAGGTPPYSWSLQVGVLPTGLSLDSSTGVVSGTPTATGSSSIKVRVQDSASPPATTVSAPLTISISPAQTNATLSGDYAFSLNGYNNGTPVIVAGRFTADGNGGINSGVLDGNRAGSPPVTALPFTGTYSINADGLGTMTLNPSQGSTLKFAVALSGTTGGKLIQSDASDPQVYGSGDLKAQTIVDLTVGSFAWGAAGVDSSGNRIASAAGFQFKNSTDSLVLTSGTSQIDINDGGTVTSGGILSGSYSATDSATGRGTASLSVNGGQAQNFSYYVVGTTELIQMSIDQVSATSPLTIGSVLRQVSSGAGFTNTALKGFSVMQLSGVDPNGGNPSADVIAGLFNGDGTTDGNGFGNATLLFDENDGGTLNPLQPAGGQYKVSHITGRVTLNGFGGTPPVFYLVAPNQAFVVSTSGNASSGVLAPQVGNATGLPYANNSVLGSYQGGSFTPVLASVTNQVAWLLADGNGNINVMQDTSGPGGPQSNQFALTYQVDATGRVLIYSNPGGVLQGVTYVVSPSKIVVMSTDVNPVLSSFGSAKTN